MTPLFHSLPPRGAAGVGSTGARPDGFDEPSVPNADRLRRPRGAPARRQALRSGSTLGRDGIYWVPLTPEQSDGIPTQPTSTRYKCCARCASTAEKPRALLAAAAEPCRPRAAGADVEASDRRRSASFLRTPFHYSEAQGDEIQSFVGTRSTTRSRGRGAAPQPEAGRPSQRRGRAARRPTLHMSTAAATVHDAFSRVAARRGDAEFLCVETVTAAAYGIDAGPRSWREVAGEVERLRAAYAQAGYGHGHRVGLLLENRPAFFTHWLALNSLGISIVPIHADLRATELTHLIGHSEIGLAVAMPNREGGLRAPPAAKAGVNPTRSGQRSPGRIPAARSPARLAREPSGAAPSAPCSTPRGRPAGRMAAVSPTVLPARGEWYLGLPRARRGGARRSTASSRRCRSAT